MAKGQPQAYTVRTTKLFDQQVETTFGSFERWDEIADALYRHLPMHPHDFPVIPGTGYRAVTLETPVPWTVYFVINEEEGCLDFEGLL
jgi:hypothetical protein